MSRGPDWTDGPAKWAAAAVLGAAGIIGIGRSFFVDRVHAPPSQQVSQQPEPVTSVTHPARKDPGRAQPSGAEASGTAKPGTDGNAETVAARLNVNTAIPSDLELLPGIGPVYAQRIVDDREANGPFASLKDLQRVKGIGPKTAEKLGPLLRFDVP